MENHKISEIFPLMNEQEFKSLKSDIEQNGLFESIITYENQILDGRNRRKACLELGIKPRYTEFQGEDPLIYVISHNLHRRHLNESQRAMVGAKLKAMFEIAAKERQGSRTDIKANLPECDRHQSRDDAAISVNVSPRSIQTAITVKEKCIPEIIEEVEAGNIAVSDAVKASNMTEEDQAIAIQAVQSGNKKTINSAKNEIENEKLKNQPVKPFEKDKYSVIIVDPPWPMKKIDRDIAPNQTGFDYPVMEIEEIKKINIPAADDCHLFLWTTHKFLPASFDIVSMWGFKYVCCFVWHKTGGFQVYGLPQYNCEFCLYCRKGAPKFVDLKAFSVCFNAARGAHSEKPDEFYNMIRRVTSGNRLDIFNRRAIDGFDGYGNESK